MIGKLIVSSLLLMYVSLTSKAQLAENFNDGDFINNPSWAGDTADFVVNSALQLQSNSTAANSSYFLTTPASLQGATQWEFYVQINFNPSSANYIDVYLAASGPDLSAVNTTGYFVRIGNTDDEISLYRKDATGIVVKIIDGANGILNNSGSGMKIKVVRDGSDTWILNRDLTGSGSNYITEGNVADATYASGGFFGFFIKQSNSSFFQKHYFDDIEIKRYIPDNQPPSIISASATSATVVDVLFDEALDYASCQVAANYTADNGLGKPIDAVQDLTNPSIVHLTFSNNFTNGYSYTLTVAGVKDLSGNPLNNGTAKFAFYQAQQHDVVIDEIMADPAPVVRLPDYEWIELKNTSSFPINLKGWKLGDLSTTSGVMPAFILEPDSFVIVCIASAFNSLSVFGKVISVSGFPSLDNNGDLISLYSSEGKTIHAVQYNSSWYQNDLKKDGGWTLEMIDTRSPCIGFANWKSSVNSHGGTPGKINSVDGANADQNAPAITKAFTLDDSTITLVFNEPLDSVKASENKHYTFNNGLVAVSSVPRPPLFDKVDIVLSETVKRGIIYTVSVMNVADCSGNLIGAGNSARFGTAEDSDSMDVVINEILYHPRSEGVDYVEIYNRSKKIIDLNHVYIANRNGSNALSSIQQAAPESQLLFPGDFMVLTSDESAVKKQYVTLNPGAFINISSMPSFPNDAGDVIILNAQGDIIDEVVYSDQWQFPLVSNTQGVSLERIDYNGHSVQNNFHSAATSVGFGTPGYKNSQYSLNEIVKGQIKVYPDIFSPDNDGTDDFATIEYNFPSPGYVANITIFDASGRPVRYLERNALSGLKGYYRWDGLDDRNRKLPQGMYVIYTEIFNAAGRKRQVKNTIVLARRY